MITAGTYTSAASTATPSLSHSTYCAPLAALRGLWRAFGASSADAKGALASFHSAIIDASVLREEHHTRLMRSWFRAQRVQYEPNCVPYLLRTHDVRPRGPGGVVPSAVALLVSRVCVCQDCGESVRRVAGVCARCGACADCCRVSLCPHMRPGEVRSLPPALRAVFCADSRAGRGPRHDGADFSYDLCALVRELPHA